MMLPNNVVTQKPSRRRGRIVLDHTCDWVIDEKRDTAICRTHGEVMDGTNSEHFPKAFHKVNALLATAVGRNASATSV